VASRDAILTLLTARALSTTAPPAACRMHRPPTRRPAACVRRSGSRRGSAAYAHRRPDRQRHGAPRRRVRGLRHGMAWFPSRSRSRPCFAPCRRTSPWSRKQLRSSAQGLRAATSLSRSITRARRRPVASRRIPP